LLIQPRGVLDGLSDTTDSLLKLLIPGGFGAAFGAAIGGPAGAMVGAVIGKAIDIALGSLIDNVFGCDCPVASDTVTFLPGDLQLFPIQSTKMYRGLSSGVACVDSFYEISSILTKVPDSATPDVQPTANWTVSLLDKNANLDYGLINVGDTLYSSGYPPRSWTQTGGMSTFPRLTTWSSYGRTLTIEDGYAVGFDTYLDSSSRSRFGLIKRSFTPDVLSDAGCSTQYSCPAIAETIMTASSLPVNLQRKVYVATYCKNAQIFLTGLQDENSYKITTEAYLVDTKTGNFVRIDDTPFPVGKDEDALLYTGSWSKYDFEA
jgi:hypothetical protein